MGGPEKTLILKDDSKGFIAPEKFSIMFTDNKGKMVSVSIPSGQVHKLAHEFDKWLLANGFDSTMEVQE